MQNNIETLRRCIIYILVHITPEMIQYLLFVILQIPMALQVVMILAIDLGTDLLPAIALAYEVCVLFNAFYFLSVIGQYPPVCHHMPRRWRELLWRSPHGMQSLTVWLEGSCGQCLKYSKFVFLVVDT